ncbi:MAG: hypothetical protein AAGD32_09225 [Planctomycetota bacterium]
MIAICAFLLFSVAPVDHDGKDQRAALVEDVLDDFIIDDEPIHPMVIEPFMPTMKGGAPKVLSVSLDTSLHLTSWLDEPVSDSMRPAYLIYSQTSDLERLTIWYDHIGVLSDNRVVLRAAINHGGTMTIVKTLILRVVTVEAIVEGDGPEVIVALEKVLPLDHFGSSVEIAGDVVTVTRPSEGAGSVTSTYDLSRSEK